MGYLRKLYAGLKLQINETKRAVARAFGGEFPGHAPRGRTQHGASGGETTALPAGLEGVLRVGANTKSLARARRMAASPPEGYPAQALEAAQSNLPRAQSAWGEGKCG